MVPAHNEEIGISSTIQSLKLQLRSEDRVVVVADNCTDNTAAIAASLDVEVVERTDLTRVGKGYALDRGIQYLSENPPEVLIVVDADCHFTEGSIDVLATTCERQNIPTQSLNLMQSPYDFADGFEFAEFAWKVKNWVRPLGLRALGLPCQLTGTGMAFPWHIIHSADLANGEIVEDLKLGLELAKAGLAPVFCPASRVISYFPTSSLGARTQRERWEQGHLSILVGVAPRLIAIAICRNRPSLLALALDVSVPPIVLLAAIQTALLLLSTVALAAGLSGASFAVAAVSLAALTTAIALCWRDFGVGTLPLRKLGFAPAILAQKLGLYHRMLSGGRPKHWIRTDRGEPKPPKERTR